MQGTYGITSAGTTLWAYQVTSRTCTRRDFPPVWIHSDPDDVVHEFRRTRVRRIR